MEATPKFHIFGVTGLIGSALAKACMVTGREFIGYSQTGAKTHQIDISSEEQVMALANIKSNDYIVNLAAIAQPQKVEKDPTRAHAVNIVGNENLAMLSRQKGCKYFLMSSVEVFSGIDTAIYEEDERRPINIYGKQKLLAEDYIFKQDWRNWVVGRTSWNISSTNTGRCLVPFMIASLSRPDARMAVDNLFTIASSMDTAKNIIRALESRFLGTVHIASPSQISRYDIAEIIMNNYTRQVVDCRPCMFDDLDISRVRSRMNILDVKRSIACFSAHYTDPYEIVLKRVLELNSESQL